MNSNIRDFTNNKTNEPKRTEASDKANETLARSARNATVTSRDVADAASTANAKLEEYGVNTDQMVDAARRRTGELQDAFASSIRANPLRSVAIAAGVGYLYALIRR